MSEGEVSDEILQRYYHADLATLWTAVHHRINGPVLMAGVRSFQPGVRLVGRARTLRYMPMRRNIGTATAATVASTLDVRQADTPEYAAMGRCGPGDVLVCDFRGVTGSGNIGDVKAYLLKQRRAEGIVMDGSIRDVKTVQSYGLRIFATDHTPLAVMGTIDQYDENVPVACGGVLVNPGDLIVGDDDGVLVVPKELAVEIIDYAQEYDALEDYIKELADRENVPPGTYYPPSEEFRARYRREKLRQE